MSKCLKAFIEVKCIWGNFIHKDQIKSISKMFVGFSNRHLKRVLARMGPYTRKSNSPFNEIYNTIKVFQKYAFLLYSLLRKLFKFR